MCNKNLHPIQIKKIITRKLFVAYHYVCEYFITDHIIDVWDKRHKSIICTPLYIS